MDKGTINLSTANAVGAILNKKMGVTTGFSPSVWADTVNLMGKLPEKTVGGTIANFPDGADGVPLKNLVANIPANEEGVSSIEVTAMGKNLAIFSKAILDNDRTDHGVTFHATSENTIHISGTATGGTAYMVDAYPIGDSRYAFFKKGTYKLSCNMPDNGNYTVAYLNGYYKGTTTTFNTAQNCKTGAPKTFTLTDDAFMKIQIMVYNGYSIDQDVWLQIEVGSTATNYESFVTPVIKTVQLGRTIYGGTADVVTGEGEDENGNSFLFEPVTVNSLLGTNTIWNDAGDTSVTYRRDIDLALSSSAPLMMMSRPPVTNEENITEEENQMEGDEE